MAQWRPFRLSRGFRAAEVSCALHLAQFAITEVTGIFRGDGFLRSKLVCLCGHSPGTFDALLVVKGAIGGRPRPCERS